MPCEVRSFVWCWVWLRAQSRTRTCVVSMKRAAQRATSQQSLRARTAWSAAATSASRRRARHRRIASRWRPTARVARVVSRAARIWSVPAPRKMRVTSTARPGHACSVGRTTIVPARPRFARPTTRVGPVPSTPSAAAASAAATAPASTSRASRTCRHSERPVATADVQIRASSSTRRRPHSTTCFSRLASISCRASCSSTRTTTSSVRSHAPWSRGSAGAPCSRSTQRSLCNTSRSPAQQPSRTATGADGAIACPRTGSFSRKLSLDDVIVRDNEQNGVTRMVVPHDGHQ